MCSDAEASKPRRRRRRLSEGETPALNSRTPTAAHSRALLLIRSARYRAKLEGWEFDLDLPWMLERLSRGVCEASGLTINVVRETVRTGPRIARSSSLDRIDNARGYTKDNCRIVCWMFNAAKAQFTDEEVLALAMGITSKMANPGLEITRLEIK